MLLIDLKALRKYVKGDRRADGREWLNSVKMQNEVPLQESLREITRKELQEKAAEEPEGAMRFCRKSFY